MAMNTLVFDRRWATRTPGLPPWVLTTPAAGSSIVVDPLNAARRWGQVDRIGW